MKALSLCRAGILTALAAAVAGCHSYHVETTIENRSGDAIHLLEVDYPSASFGKDALEKSAEYHYRFQIRGSGKLKVQYTNAAEKQVEIDGPELSEGEEGRLEIVLLPQGKAEFHSTLAPRR